MRWMLVCLLLAGSLYAQDDFGILQLADTHGRNLKRATVEFKEADTWTLRVADESGGYGTGPGYGVNPITEMISVSWLIFRRVPAGELTLRVSLDHYEPVEKTVTIQSRRNCLETITLTPTVGNSVTVTVLDADDKPVEGAKVRVQLRTCGETGADGKAVATEVFSQSGEVDLTVLAEGYEEPEVVRVREPGQKLEFRLKRSARLYGKVTGADRACCELKVFTDKAGKNSVAAYETRCDVEGNYSITLRRARYPDREFKGGSVTLRLLLGGQATELPVQDLKAGEWREIEVPAPEGGTLTGLITGCDGKPIASLYLEIGTWRTRDLHTYTDADGRFKVSALPEGEYVIRIGLYGSDGYPDQGKRKAKVQSGKETVCNVDMSGTLAIRVRAFIDNEPVKIISVGDWNISISAEANVSNGGWVTMNGLKPGRYDLKLGIHSSGVVEQTLRVASTDQPQEFEIYVEHAGVRGRVKVPAELAGKSRDEWRVTLYDERGIACEHVPIADDDTYSITGIDPGTYTVVARAENWCSKPAKVKVAGAETADLELELAGSLTLKVVSDDVDPVAVTVLLRISEEDPKLGYSTPETMGGARLAPGETSTVASVLQPGKYAISFAVMPDLTRRELDTPLIRPLDRQTFEIRAGETTELTVKVARCCGLSISGLPVNARAEDVELLDGEGNEIAATFTIGTSRQTAYASCLVLDAGKFTLKLKVKGYKLHEQEVELVLGKTLQLEAALEKEE